MTLFHTRVSAVRSPLRCFLPVASDYFTYMVKISAANTYVLDPICTKILKECKAELGQILTKLINKSLVSAKMPTELKHSIIAPRLKKASITHESKLFRSVSNLPNFSKLIEEAVMNWLDIHAHKNDIDEPYQSGYKSHHSSKTALIYITNSFLQSCRHWFPWPIRRVRCCWSSNPYLATQRMAKQWRNCPKKDQILPVEANATCVHRG